jgi:hypothetical protein
VADIYGDSRCAADIVEAQRGYERINLEEQ